jgi:hypothetical protein
MSAPEPQATAKPARHPLVQRILDGSAGESIRLTAARGALPLPLQDLLYAQIRLLQDEAPAVVQAATESLAKLTGEALLPIVRDPVCDPIVIDHFARGGRLQGGALEAAIAHPAILDGTLEALAASAPAETLNLIVTNEVRLIKNPRLLEVLRGNPQLSTDNRRRLMELERDFIGKEQLRVRAPAAEAAPAAGAAPEASAATLEGVPGVPVVPAEGEAPPPDDAAAPPEPLSEEEQLQYEEQLRKTPAFQKIMKMNVAERLQLAMKGNTEERAILIRDTAKMVAHAVIKSPKLSDNEITTFAAMRNIHEEILRVIASKKEWTKNYATVHALVRNPKTPPGLSLQFLARLGNRDLKIVAGDKNIPDLVRRNARNMFMVRTQPPKKMGKKAH